MDTTESQKLNAAVNRSLSSVFLHLVKIESFALVLEPTLFFNKLRQLIEDATINDGMRLIAQALFIWGVHLNIVFKVQVQKLKQCDFVNRVDRLPFTTEPRRVRRRLFGLSYAATAG
ncbi:hypothetical protein [Labrenzia sp. 011]|uniref:hypothetical protein n=1 Tax=Labrenzia sp. 011 TaxID=2171494 RepID=UPI0010572692|nr:hypothetical protein [Labrenzia sp. 011]